MKLHLGLIALASCELVLAASTPAASSTRSYTDSRTGLTIVGATFTLSAAGQWELQNVRQNDGLRELQLLPPADVMSGETGTRLRQLHERRAIQQAQQQLQSLYSASFQYGNEHQGIGPASFNELGPEFDWIEAQGTATNFALVPHVRLPRFDSVSPTATERAILALEVRPRIADGRHWILWNDGRIERVAIDAERAAALGWTIEPQEPPPRTTLATAEYRILGRRTGESTVPIVLTLHNRFSGETLEVQWSPESSEAGGPELLRDWALLRTASWRLMGDAESATVLGWWLRQTPTLYGLDPVHPQDRRPRNPGPRTTAFNVMGGRAAIQETLQLENISDPETHRLDHDATVAIDQIPGVQVKAHEYAALLQDRQVGRLPLAELVPADRLFAWFPQPGALPDFLDAGSDFGFGLSSGITGNSLNYELTDRYLARLGLNETQVRTLLESGALTELAIVLPDLHFIDGTDLTVIARLADSGLASRALTLLGLDDLTEPLTRRLADGDSVHWLKQGDLLILSSQRTELDRVLELARSDGAGSLGQSAEFRYMLTLLPPRQGTQGYIYLSDPFIRRLTGPEAKIGQLRRLTARAQMEALAAGALLHALDHPGTRPSADDLLAMGYAPRLGGFEPSTFSLDAQGKIRSEEFGHPANLKTLLDHPITRATPAEAAAYDTYRENYERYWRQFFDPIAIRLDETQPGHWEMETFILPLIDSTIYDRLRRSVATAESRVPLAVPVLEPGPVAMLSANLTDAVWVDALQDMNQLLVPILGHESLLLDQLGPGIHFAIADSDPVLSLGSGDLLEIFGGANSQLNQELFLLPAAISLLTRPSAIAIELRDPSTAIQELKRVRTGTRPPERGFLGLTLNWYQVSGEPAWILALSFEGVMKLRFSLTVQGRYLVISNQPLTYRPRVLAERAASNNGLCLELRPAGVQKLGHSLRLASLEKQREAARSGCVMLYPHLLAGASSVDEAAHRHQQAFGFAPAHPPGGTFVWEEGRVASTMFGQPGAEHQPAFNLADDHTGLLRQIHELVVSLQFEQDGLRVVTAWSVRR
jgi:hypothetical protein